MLGQTLRLLQVTEATLHLWQRLRLQRVRQVEPHLLMSAVESTREWYQEQAIADAQLMESVGKKLRDFGMQRPLEIHRPLSRRAVRKELQYVWADTAEFARARQGSIEALPEYEDPGVRDAFSQLRKEAGAARQAAREVSRSTAQIVGRRFKVAGRSLRTTAERANTRRHADREDD